MLSKKQLLQICCLFAFCISNAWSIKTISWNYEFISIGANSSDENLMRYDFKLVRIERGVYGISGEMFINCDIEPNDNMMVELVMYRSATGSADYKRLPFSIKKQHLYKFYDTYYKDTVMGSLKTCSDLPNFKNKFEPPLEKKTYKLNTCQISTEGFPQHLAAGFYKIQFIGSGKVDFVIEAIIKVETELF